MMNDSQNQLPASKESSKKAVSISEAAQINKVTRQAIYIAIKQQKLRAHKDRKQWTIDLNDLDEYRKNRYSRTKSRFEGELLFDNSKGYYSIHQVAQMLGVPKQKIYYATRVGLLKAARKRIAWVIHIDEVKKYQESYLAKKSIQLQAG